MGIGVWGLGRLVGVVHHVGGVASRRAHVHFQAHIVSLLAQAFAVAVQLEELQVHEAALDVESLHRAAANLGELGGDGLVGVVAGVQVVVDNLHDGCGEHAVVLEDGLPVRVKNGVVAYQEAGNELLHHIILEVVRMGGEPGIQFLGIADFGGAAGAHAAVRLGNDGIAGLLHEGLYLGRTFGPFDLTGRGNAAQGIVFFHLALVADGGNLVVLDAGGHVEVCPEAGVLFQPVLVVGFNPVNLAPLVGKPGHGPVHFLVVAQIVYLVVVAQALPELPGQVLVVGVRNTQHIDAVGLEAGAEMPVGLRKMGGDEY